MLNLGKPPLSPNKTYCWPFNDPEYVKDSDPYAHVRVFKVTIRAYSEIDYVRIVNMFIFTFNNIMSNWHNNYMGDYLDCTFAKLQLVFCKKV
jgi:hypothetical protein